MHNTSFPQPGTPGATAQPPANLPQANTEPAVVPITQPAPQQPVVDAQAATPNLLQPGAMMAQAQQPASVTAAPLLGASAGSKRNAPDSGFDQPTNGMAPGAWGAPPGPMPMLSMPFFDGAGRYLPYYYGYGWSNHGFPAQEYDPNALSFHGGSFFGPQGAPQPQGLHAPLPSSRARNPLEELIRAASSGDAAAVLAWLAAGMDVNAVDMWGTSALMAAVKNGHETIVQLLLAVPDIDIHAEASNGQTALQRAIYERKDGIERMILAALNKHTEKENKSVNTALLSAVARGDKVAVRTLLANPAIDINSKEEFGITALHVAASLGDQEIFSLLLAKPGIEVNAIDATGRTALMRAVKKGHEAIVRKLVDMPGIDVNACSAKFDEGKSALEFAVEEGHVTIVRALLTGPAIEIDHIADALNIAAKNGHQEIVEALLAMPGIAGNRASSCLCSVLMDVVKEGTEAVVEALLATPDIDINCVAETNLQSALVGAALTKSEDTVSALFAMPGIDINARGRDGITALTLAACYGRATVVHTMLAQPGIRTDIVDDNGNTALSIARSLCHDDVVQALQNHVPASPAAPPDTVLNLLQTIFTIHSGKPQHSTASSADIVFNPDAAMKLDRLCESLEFGKCAAADVPALFTTAGPLPASAYSALALALAFGFCTGHYRNADGALDEASAAAVEKAGLRTSFDDAVQKLSLAKKHINLCRIDGMNLLGIAAKAGNERMIRGLVRLGTYVNLPSPNGKTALAIAVENRQWGACAELVFHGALPTLPLKDGYPALYHIVRAFNSDAHASKSLALLIRYLRKKGVSFDIPVMNPDESMRKERPAVSLYELLVTNPQFWIEYADILLDLPASAPPAAPAPTTTAATPANAPAAL